MRSTSLRRRRWRTTGLLLLALSCLACTRPGAEGEPYEVLVLADSARHAAMEPMLDSLFAQHWLTSPPEPLLAWRWATPATPDLHLTHRNLLILSDGAPVGPVGRFLDEVLGAGMRDRIAKEEAFLFRKPDAFAQGQLLLILAAPNPASLLRQTRRRADELRAQFLDHEQATERAAFQGAAPQKELEDSLALACGFRLGIPAEWFVVQGSVSPPFIRLRRLNPDRWITVHWVDGADSQRLDESGMRSVRSRLGSCYWEREQPDPGPGRFRQLRLNGLETSLLEGSWSDGQSRGNPFLLYAVHVPGVLGLPQGRTFYIDAAVRNPGGARSPYLHQLDQLVAGFAGADPEGRAIGPLQPAETEE